MTTATLVCCYCDTLFLPRGKVRLQTSLVYPQNISPGSGPHLARAHGGRNGVGRQWQEDLHVGRGGALLELAARLDQVLSAAAAVLLHRALHPDQRPHVLAQPVCPAAPKS